MKKAIYNLKKVWVYFAPYKKPLIIFGILSFAIGVLGIFIPLLTAQIISNITNYKLNKVIYIAIAYFGINVAINILKYINNKIFYKFQSKAVKNIRLDYCRNILDVQTGIFEKKGSGLFLSRFSTDLVTFSYIFYQIISNFNTIIINIGIYLIVFYINVYIGIYFVISSVFLFYLNKIRLKYKNKIWREFKLIDEKNQSVFSEMLRGFVDLKVLNLQKGMLKYIDNNLTDNQIKSYDMDMLNSKYDFLDNLIQNVFRLVFLILCFFFVKHNQLNIEGFLVLFVYQDKIYNTIYAISHLSTEMNLFNLCSSNILEIIDENGLKKETYGTKKIKNLKGELVFKNVNFSYNEHSTILKNINFKINPKEKIAIVGKSGVGKSTIISLISRLYDVNSGEILIDGINISDLSKETLRESISVITQDPYIFNLSIKENLLLAKDGVSDKQIIEKCKLVQLHDFIMTLPDGYDTLLEENGVNLSGGQKQRLAIARALLKNSKIIVFDEATNSLDLETQNTVKESINLLRTKYTLIIISHSLFTITDCDKIFLIDKGQIVESGKHKDMINNKLYSELYNSD